MVGNITFLWFLLFSMCYSLHVAVNVCINCSFVHFLDSSKVTIDDQMVYLMLEIGYWPVSSLNFGGGEQSNWCPPTQTNGLTPLIMMFLARQTLRDYYFFMCCLIWSIFLCLIFILFSVYFVYDFYGLTHAQSDLLCVVRDVKLFLWTGSSIWRISSMTLVIWMESILEQQTWLQVLHA